MEQSQTLAMYSLPKVPAALNLLALELSDGAKIFDKNAIAF
ncbi:MAG TPA: hypothetical protein VH415_03800 [Nitrososphaeraceae archaeon]